MDRQFLRPDVGLDPLYVRGHPGIDGWILGLPVEVATFDSEGGYSHLTVHTGVRPQVLQWTPRVALQSATDM